MESKIAMHPVRNSMHEGTDISTRHCKVETWMPFKNVHKSQRKRTRNVCRCVKCNSTSSSMPPNHCTVLCRGKPYCERGFTSSGNSGAVGRHEHRLPPAQAGIAVAAFCIGEKKSDPGEVDT